MRYYLDTEFDGFNGPLLSIALVREDGCSIYAMVKDRRAKCAWVKANVVPLMLDCPVMPAVMSESEIGRWLAGFMKGDPHPHVVADWPDDHRYLCQLLITGPGEMVSIPHLTMEVVRVDAYPTPLADAVQHNAWWDAQALRHKLAPESFT